MEINATLLFCPGIALLGLAFSIVIILAVRDSKNKGTNLNLKNLWDTKNQPPEEIYPYTLNKKFLSYAETEFFHILEQATEKKAVILTKVNLGDLFFVQHPQWGRYRARIDRRHVDYLICHPKTLKPVLGIELDDNSHNSAKAKEIDALKDNAFKAAGLPLLRVPVQHTYNTKELQENIIQTARNGR